MMLVNTHKLTKYLLIGILFLMMDKSHAQSWSLEQCIDTAQKYNRNLAMVNNSMLLSAEKEKEALSNLLPKIFITGDYKYFFDLPYQLMPMTAFGGPEGQFKATQFGVPHSINAAVQLNMPLYNPQIYGAIRTSKIGNELGLLQLRKTEEQVFYEVSNLYYNLQILNHQISFIDGNLLNNSKLLEGLRLLNQQLMIPGTEVDKVELQNEMLKTQKELALAQLNQATNALKFVMGVSIGRSIEIQRDLTPFLPKEYDKNSNSDFLIAMIQKDIIESDLRTLQQSRLPSVNLYGSYGQSGFGYDEEPNEFLDFYPNSFAGIQLSIPLFNGMVTYRKIKQKKIELANSSIQLNMVEEQNHMNIENAMQQRMVSYRTLDNALQNIALAQKIYDQTILQQQEGIASVTEVILADNAISSAQQNYLSALVDYLKADLELRKLTGNISINK